MSEHEGGAGTPVKSEEEARLLVVGMLAAPVAWLLHLTVSYALVHPICSSGAMWIHHAVTLAALLLAAPGGWAAWREWSRTPKDEDPAPPGRHRTHFLAIAGITNSAFFILIIVLSWSAALAISPCDLP